MSFILRMKVLGVEKIAPLVKVVPLKHDDNDPSVAGVGQGLEVLRAHWQDRLAKLMSSSLETLPQKKVLRGRQVTLTSSLCTTHMCTHTHINTYIQIHHTYTQTFLENESLFGLPLF